MAVRVRYAPSPTGSPHVGNLRTAIFNWLFARTQNGRFIARLEDTDRTPERYCPEGIWDLEESLRYLGIVPDEWWVGGGSAGPYVQSERLPLYRQHLDVLIEQGRAYRCFCTRDQLDEMRKKQQDQGAPTGYDRRCRGIPPEEAARRARLGAVHTVRLAMPLSGQAIVHDVIKGDVAFEYKTQDDQVLLKSDGFPTYFLACVVDDHLMAITHVIRGDDWLSSAPKLVALYDALGWEAPAFAHLPLILGPDRKKLSKRHGSTQFTDFIAEGYLPEALFNFLMLLGWSTGEEQRELLTISEILDRFSLEGVSQHPAVFDYAKLGAMNGHYIRASQAGRIVGLCLPFLIKAGLVADPPSAEEMDIARKAIPLEIEKMKVLSECVHLTRYFFEKIRFPEGYDERAIKKWFGVSHLPRLLDELSDRLSRVEDWSAASIEAIILEIAALLELPVAQVIHPSRVAVTGRTAGPGLYDAIWALGKAETLARIDAVIALRPKGENG